MFKVRFYAGFLGLLTCLGISASATADDLKFGVITPADRREMLSRAHVWQPVEIERMDLQVGPTGKKSFRPGQAVRCRFREYEEEATGATAKFKCDLPVAAGEKPDDVKVKYGAKNGEVYAEVAATRLLWALGFGADAMYSVAVTCEGCAKDPWSDFQSYRRSRVGSNGPTYRPASRGTFAFEPAAIERKLKGERINEQKVDASGRLKDVKEDQGWKFEELEDVSEARGGAPRAHVDALKLLTAFLQHGDNKGANQRAVCLPGGTVDLGGGRVGCTRPFMYLQDVGATFGGAGTFTGGGAKMSFSHWAAKKVWRNPALCEAELDGSSSGSLDHPRISEAGRAFLAGLLNRLSREQIVQLFAASNVARDPRHRDVPISEWVRVFEDKRAEITRHRCLN